MNSSDGWMGGGWLFWPIVCLQLVKNEPGPVEW